MEDTKRCFSYLLGDIISGILTHESKTLAWAGELAGCGGFLSSACCTSISADVAEHWHQ